MILSKEIDLLISISREASTLLLDFYDKGFEVEIKEDGSPLTNADLAADHFIQDALRHVIDIPIVSEENPYEINLKSAGAPLYWLIDPLDGTRGFIRKNGHFCINIALMENNKPILGVIALPTENEIYVGYKDQAYHINKEGKRETIHTRSFPKEGIDALVGSTKAQHDDLYEDFFSKFKIASLKARGGASKFCYIAKGTVDLYIRFSKCYEWDVAAGHVIVEAAGGLIQDLKGRPITYGEPQFVNPGFMVFGQNHDLPFFS